MSDIPLLPPSDFSSDFWSKIRTETRPIVVYGMGNGGDKLLARLSEEGVEISDFFASDGFVRGQIFHGKKVLSFSEIKEKYESFVILVSFGSHLSEVVERIYGLAEDYELYIPDMPLAGETYFDAPFYQKHYKSICRAYELLQDDFSKRIFVNTVWYKLTALPQYLRQAVFAEDEKELLGFSSLKVAVDVGAYRGDTLKELWDEAPCLQEVHALEPDRKNFIKLSAYAQTLPQHLRIFCYHVAAWESDGTRAFAVSGNRNAAIIGEKNEQKNNFTSFEYASETVEVSKIDTLMQGRNVDYIKYDTEGAECAALNGSCETIRRSVPSLLISSYHRSEDLFSLLLWLEERFGGKYDYYIRRKDCIPAWDLNLIAVPRR